MSSNNPPSKDAPLTVNEQVIVMSGHETIRVLEVEVDGSQSSSASDGKSEGKADEGSSAAGEQPAVRSAPKSVTTGSLGQPLLIPLNMSGSIGGQGGLAVLTLPTTNVATLPGLAATNAAGNLIKLPFTGLQGKKVWTLETQQVESSCTSSAATVLNSIQPQLQTSAQTVFQPQTASIQPVQTAMQQVTPQPAQVTNAQVFQLPMFNFSQISAASLGAQPQFLTSLTSTPILSSAISSMAGITSQLITNAQGQVIGTLPLLVNPGSLAGGATTSTLPLQGLQVQAVTPQLLLNTQGQIIATVGNGPKHPNLFFLPSPFSQASVTAATQSPVVIAPQPSMLKTAATHPSMAPINCGELAKVGQLVSKPQQTASSEEGINLEEIREFAKNFKIRRLSLGLTQTQVGQALTATEGPAYSQSAICRFEKLDITPKSAQKLKPVLEKWLAEAEHWNQKGQQNLMEFVGGEPSKKRKRRTSFTPQAIEVLNSYFEKNALPTGQEITEIARELNYDREVVRVWFCNRRQTLKNTSKINVFQV
uniref:POU domain protein n=1 Tax=Oryzias latipes TaxID=8090 RepID=A0A3P9M3P1_ORYLA